MLEVYKLEQSDQWDSIVRSFKEYDVYWLSGYTKGFHIHGDGEPLLFYFKDDQTRGINVVMKRDVADDIHFKDKIDSGCYYDFATPYGYGGWLIEGKSTMKLFDSYDDWAKNHHIISEFVRFHPMLQNQDNSKNYYEIIQLGEVVHMNLDSPEDIWANISSKNRNVIRKAINNGVEIYNGRFPEIYEKFRMLYNSTMDKDNAEEYYYFGEQFYKSVLLDLPHNAQVFWAEKEGRIIAASIMLTANGRMNYHLSGSDREFSSLASTNLLLYQAALWGSAHGVKTLYLGGGVGSGEDSLFRFKKAFHKASDLNHFYIGRKVFDSSIYDELMDLRGENVKNSNFFPAYRG